MTWHPSQGRPYYPTVKEQDWRAKPRPQCWIYPDPFDHVRHNAYLKSKSQAAHRLEEWLLSIEDYFQLWPQELWARRGRTKDSLCMIRTDPEKAWSLDNCEIVDRKVACRSRNQRRDNIRNKNVQP